MKTIEAVYVGRRLIQKGGVGYFWLFDGDADPKGYTKPLAYAIIGERFKLTLSEDGSVYTRGKDLPKSISHTLDERHIEWSALDTAAKAEHDGEKALKSMTKNNKQFEKAIEPLAFMMSQLNNNMERTAFVMKVTSELWKR